MKYSELGMYIPFRFSGGEHNVIIPLTKYVKIAGPGKYGQNSGGSDFVVLASNEDWEDHKISWEEVFVIFDHLSKDAQAGMLISLKRCVLEGADLPEDWYAQTVAVLSYCEHRRYARKFSEGGGKALPLNILTDIYSDRNTGEQAAKYMRTGIANVKRVTFRG